MDACDGSDGAAVARRRCPHPLTDPGAGAVFPRLRVAGAVTDTRLRAVTYTWDGGTSSGQGQFKKKGTHARGTKGAAARRATPPGPSPSAYPAPRHPRVHASARSCPRPVHWPPARHTLNPHGPEHPRGKEGDGQLRNRRRKGRQRHCRPPIPLPPSLTPARITRGRWGAGASSGEERVSLPPSASAEQPAAAAPSRQHSTDTTAARGGGAAAAVHLGGGCPGWPRSAGHSPPPAHRPSLLRP